MHRICCNSDKSGGRPILPPSPALPRLHQLKLAQLRFLARLGQTGQIVRAAEAVGISQPTASRMLVEIEALVGHPIHQRSGRGIVLTPVGRALALRAERIALELDDAAADLREIAAGGQGHLRIGSVTAPALELVLPALRSLRLTDPGITADVTVAPSALLCQELAAGRLDLAFGRVAAPEDLARFDVAPFGTEPVALVVRRGHPLDRGERIALPELHRYDWVMPGTDSPLGRAVVARLAELGSPLPRQPLTTASFLLTLTMVQQSDAIAPLARAVAQAFAGPRESPYVALDTALEIDSGTFGLLRRKGAVPTATARKFLDAIDRIRGTGA